MALDQLLLDAEQRDLGLVRVGDRAAGEVIRGARPRGDPGGHLAAAAGLGQAQPVAAQQTGDDLVDRRPVLAEQVAPVALDQGPLHRLRLGRGLLAPADVDLDLPSPQAGGDLDRVDRGAPPTRSRPGCGRSPTPAPRTSAGCSRSARSPGRAPPARRPPRSPASTSAAARAGGPGRTITTVSPAGTTRPGAVPSGSSAVEPSGIIACLRLAARIASVSNRRQRLAKARRIAAIFSSISSSRTISRPAKRPTTSAVRSSAVGPEPARGDDQVHPLGGHEAQAPPRGPRGGRRRPGSARPRPRAPPAARRSRGRCGR